MTNVDVMQNNFAEHLVIVYVYLWFQAVLYDCTNIAYTQLHCNDIIHSVYKEITL